MSTLRRIIGEGILKSLEATTVNSAGSPNQQGEHCEIAGVVVAGYCGQLGLELLNPDAYDDDNKRVLLRKIDRTIVGLAHLRDQVDPPSFPNVVPRKQDMFSVQENIRLATDANGRRHDQLVDQQYAYMEDYLREAEVQRSRLEC